MGFYWIKPDFVQKGGGFIRHPLNRLCEKGESSMINQKTGGLASR